MSGFFSSLGKSLAVPIIAPIVSEVATQGVAKVVGYVKQNFNLPGASQKAAEMGAKLNNSNLANLFAKPLVTPQKVGSDVVGALAAQYAGAVVAANTGVSSNAVPYGTDQTVTRKVTISQSPAVGDYNVLIFDVMPRIDERGGADYEAIQPLHHPGVIQKYRSSSARSWSINGKLIARNIEEATKNITIINMIRGWRMPFYGEGTAQDERTKQFLGAPPPILTLSGYGDDIVGPVKCVLKDYSWSFDNTVDYLSAVNGSAVPVIIEIQLSLEEAWSPAEYSSFNLTDYKHGKVTEAFRKRPTEGVAGPAANTSIAQEAQAESQASAHEKFRILERSQPNQLTGRGVGFDDPRVKAMQDSLREPTSADGNVKGALVGTDIYGNYE